MPSTTDLQCEGHVPVALHDRHRARFQCDEVEQQRMGANLGADQLARPRRLGLFTAAKR